MKIDKPAMSHMCVMEELLGRGLSMGGEKFLHNMQGFYMEKRTILVIGNMHILLIEKENFDIQHYVSLIGKITISDSMAFRSFSV